MTQTRFRLLSALATAVGLALALTLPSGAQSREAVRAWEGTVTIPTSIEDAPNPNPPFEQFPYPRLNYPYPLRDRLTDRQRPERWRALFLENEYLKLTVLPELGGHVYSCVDKISGRDMFYANRTLKKALIGYRGAWAAFGIEFNFPVSHNWVSLSPVDAAFATNADGSGSIWVGNVDAVYGSSWRVELRLRPARAVLDQHVTLQNRSDVRHRYYWWTNAAVEAWDDSRLIYPTGMMATHGFTRVVRWPVDDDGRDLSVVGNQTEGPVSLFTHGTREPFVGVYHPRASFGTVHLANPAELPAHKVWSWGADAEAHRWRQALSDDNSAYVELQAGPFRNQETYGFLEPQETIRFSEHWVPVREIGGITRATEDAVLHATRPSPSTLQIGLNVARPSTGLRLRVSQGDRTLLDEALEPSPRLTWSRDLDGLDGTPWRIVLSEGEQVLLEHVEGKYDLIPAGTDVGEKPAPARPIGDDPNAVLERGAEHERQGRRLNAFALYREAAAAHPHSAALGKAAGRLAVSLHWEQAGRSRDALRRTVADWLHRAYRADVTDAETRYYLGLLAMTTRDEDPRPHFEAAARNRATKPAALLQLARLDARDGNFQDALRHADALVDAEPHSIAGGALQVAMLRRLGKAGRARERLEHWLALDPTSSLLRYERTLLWTAADERLWAHLAADPNRVLDLVDHYLAIDGLAEASDLLERRYPDVREPAREPGTIAPGEHALLQYYRAYVRMLKGDASHDAFREASRARTDWVFPNRASSHRVLDAAVERDADDATALFLRGSLLFAADLADSAIQDWQRAAALNPRIPTLHRNIALALLHGDRPDRLAAARDTLVEGSVHDAENEEIYTALDQVLSLQGAQPSERVAALRRYPKQELPTALAFKLALALAEAGEHDAADEVLRGRYFAREEGGTSVRAVYAQVRLDRAAASARRGACSEAFAVLDGLPGETPGFDFTAGGLADVLRQPLLRLQVAHIERACGRVRQADERLRPLSNARSASPIPTALAYRAARQSGQDARAWTERLREAQAAAEMAIDSGDVGSPAMLHLAHGMLLDALGRRGDARAAFDAVLMEPDRNLLHHHARRLKREIRAGE